MLRPSINDAIEMPTATFPSRLPLTVFCQRTSATFRTRDRPFWPACFHTPVRNRPECWQSAAENYVVGLAITVISIVGTSIAADNKMHPVARARNGGPVNVYEEKLAGVRDELTPAAEQPLQSFMVTDLVTVAETDTIEKVIRSFVNTASL